jgi:RHS repeat-associated protein
VAGPPLRVDRTYNSMDPRTTGAFGAGWSTAIDAAVRSDSDGTGNVTVTATNGRELRFGLNADGSYAPPFGSVDVLTWDGPDQTWKLRDGSGSEYDFTGAGPIWPITQIIAPNGLIQAFTPDPATGLIQTITDSASQRALTLGWTAGSTPHVSSVTTQAPDGLPALQWTYVYTGDQLTSACAPTGCTQYAYTGDPVAGTCPPAGCAVPLYRAGVLDSGPQSYWQLGDAGDGPSAGDEVDVNLGTTDGAYHNVTNDANAAPIAGSDQTAASFNGTSSYVSLPGGQINDSTDVTIGLWFKAASASASGVLFSYAANPVTSPAGNHEPALYIGGNGELYGEFWNGSASPIHTTASVDDGNWHYAVLTASGNSQSLFLDGHQVGAALPGQIDHLGMTFDTIGAGYWASWPANTQGGATTTVGYFSGDIAQVAVYPHPLGAAAIAEHYALATASTAQIAQVTLPSGTTYESATYDTSTGRIDAYTSPDNGQWTIGQPLASGSKATSDAAGQVIDHVTVTGPADTQQTYGFDMLNGGRLISYDNGVDSPEFYGYSGAGFLSEVLDQDQSLVCIASDSHGRVVARTWHTAPAPIYVNGQIPTDGSVIQFGDGTAIPTCTAQTTSSPDCATPLASNPSADRICTTFYAYQPYTDPVDPRNNEPVSVRDARSASATDNTYLTSYGYNSAGELLTRQTPATSDFPSGRTTSYAYTVSTTPAYGGGNPPVGLLKTATTPGGAVTAYLYYQNGDLRQVTDPSNRITVYAYDALGRVSTKTVTASPSPNVQTSYTYNALGQLATIKYPGVLNQVTNVTHTRQDSYTYDPDGNVLSLTVSDTTGGDPARTTTYSYDDPDHPGRVTSRTDPGGVTTGGTAQSDGSASADPLGATSAFEYDQLGNVTKRTDPSGNDYVYAYNEYNQPISTTLVTAVQDSRTPNCSAPASVDGNGLCDLVLESRAYSPAGVLASVTDAMGRTTGYGYDPNRDLTSVTTCTGASDATCTAAGASITSQAGYTYDGTGNLTSQAVTGQGQPGSTVTNYTVDAASRVTSEGIDPTPARTSTSDYANRTVSFTYDADNHVLTQTTGSAANGGSSLISYAYDPAGTLHSQTVHDTGGPATSLTTTWQYNQDGQPVSMTSPRGNVSGATPANYTTSYGYDLAGQLVTQTEPSVSVQDYVNQAATAATPVTTGGYDTFGDLTQVKDPNQGVTSATYDGGGHVTSVTSPSYTPPGGSAITATTAYGYDEVGDLTRVTDAKNNVACYTYDALGDVTSETTPAQPLSSSQPCSTTTWTYGYDADGEQLSATDPLQKKWQATYDFFGSQATGTDPLSHTTNYAHDYLGDLMSTTTPDNVVTSRTYDHLGDLTSTTDGAGNITSYEYGYLGQKTHVIRPDGGVSKYGYDEAGNLTSQVDYTAASAGQATAPVRSQAFGYDPDGNLTSATDGRGNTTTWAYNAVGAITSQVAPVSASASITTTYGYDRAGNQTAITGGNGNTTWTTYNPWNLPQSVIKPATAAAPNAADRTWTTGYDADGLAATVTQPGGISLSYGYDAMGNLTSESGSGAAASTAAQTLTYDLDGRLASATAPGGTGNFTYFDNGSLQQATGPSGSSSFTYNGDGLVTSATGHGGTTSYTYDGADRLATLADPLTGATLTYGYNADSLPASIGYSIAGASGPTQTFGYDSLQRLTSQVVKSASGSTLASQAYAYDAAGNMTSQSTGGLMTVATTTYAYDKANRLASSTISGTTTTYGYDGDSNLTQSGGTSYSYNAQDQATSSTTTSGTTNYAYTLAGALASITPPGGSAQSYTTDAYGWVATAPGGISYAYDALGRLATRTVSGTASSMSYLGTSDTLAFDGTRNYTYDPAGNVDATQVPSSTAFTTMSNAHGDLAATFSPTSTAGGLAGFATYAPYGAPTASGYRTDVNYQGDYTDPSTHQVMMGARWYNPAVGSFSTNDAIAGMPLPSTVDGNPYAYTSGSPLTETDPTGHCVVVGIGLVSPGPCPGDPSPPVPVTGDGPGGQGGGQGGGLGGICGDATCGIGTGTGTGTGTSTGTGTTGTGSESGTGGRNTGESPSPGGTGGGGHAGESGCAWNCGSGSPTGTCTITCGTGHHRPVPPRPRDCLLAGTCPAGPVPVNLRGPVISHRPTDVTSISGIPKGQRITEILPTPQHPVLGTTVLNSAREQGSNPETDGTSSDIPKLTGPITDVGDPGHQVPDPGIQQPGDAEDLGSPRRVWRPSNLEG